MLQCTLTSNFPKTNYKNHRQCRLRSVFYLNLLTEMNVHVLVCFVIARFCVRVSLNYCDSSVVPSIILSILSRINTNFRSSHGGYANHFYIKKSIIYFNINTEKDKPTNN